MRFLFKFLTAVLVVVLFGVTSCSKKINFITSGVVLTSNGSINIATDIKYNNTIDVNVRCLVKIFSVHPPKEVNLIRLETKDDSKENLCPLNSLFDFIPERALLRPRAKLIFLT